MKQVKDHFSGWCQLIETKLTYKISREYMREIEPLMVVGDSLMQHRMYTLAKEMG